MQKDTLMRDAVDSAIDSRVDAKIDLPRNFVFDAPPERTGESSVDSTTELPVRDVRAIWISDVHLGTAGCQAESLLSFLKHHESRYLYLVGDIVDGWQLKKSWYWPRAHNDVIQKLLRRARKGCEVVYIPGNHDEAARDYCGLHMGGIAVVQQGEHTLKDGRRLLIVHGDEYDNIIRYAKWLAYVGDTLYTFTLWLNRLYNRLRVKMGYPYWSLSAYLKNKVKNAVSFMTDFEHQLIAQARRRGYDGVVCGHIHHAKISEIDGLLYCNDGDWVESLTALVETHEGQLEIVRWHSHHLLGKPTADLPRSELPVTA